MSLFINTSLEEFENADFYECLPNEPSKPMEDDEYTNRIASHTPGEELEGGEMEEAYDEEEEAPVFLEHRKKYSSYNPPAEPSKKRKSPPLKTTNDRTEDRTEIEEKIVRFTNVSEQEPTKPKNQTTKPTKPTKPTRPSIPVTYPTIPEPVLNHPPPTRSDSAPEKTKTPLQVLNDNKKELIERIKQTHRDSIHLQTQLKQNQLLLAKYAQDLNKIQYEMAGAAPVSNPKSARTPAPLSYRKVGLRLFY